jgi:thiol-disulfide isomerase/thioredoxin
MKRILLLFVYAVLSDICSNAQALNIGDNCPDLVLNNVMNYPTTRITLSQFKTRLTVLHIWATDCVPCIKMLPGLDSLQKQFGNKIQIIAVNKESLGFTKEFFAKRKSIRLPAIPFATGDVRIEQLFPQEFGPIGVWLDSGLVVRYITYGQNTTAANISAFLEGRKPDMLQLVKLEANKTLSDTSGLYFYSYLSPYVPGKNRASRSQKGELQNGKIYITEEGGEIISLIQTAITGATGFQFAAYDSTILEVKNSTGYFPPSRKNGMQELNDWEKKWRFNYYLMMPATDREKAYRFMLQDICRYFQIEASIEKRCVYQLVLVKNGNMEKLKSRGGMPVDKLKASSIRSPNSDPLRYMINMPFDDFYKRMNAFCSAYFHLPLLDETEFSGNIDIRLSATALDSGDLSVLRAELNNWGMNILKLPRMKEVLVIRDTPHGLSAAKTQRQ